MDDSASRPASIRRWLGTIVVDGRQYPTSIAYAPTSASAATIEVATLPRDAKDAAPAPNQPVAFDAPLSAPVNALLPQMVRAITGGEAASSLAVSVGAIVPAHHDCDAIVIEFATEPRPLSGPRSYAATIRLADGVRVERIAWTAETTLGEWLGRIDGFCRRALTPPLAPSARRR
ncbi:MAG TPA: hypothetical protein VFX03_02130 [Thermomicrobiales bacterium]|nr:hypothetical protein [Thermomicrobiales bacterium]